jgi:hypothetical protein
MFNRLALNKLESFALATASDGAIGGDLQLGDTRASFEGGDLLSRTEPESDFIRSS